MIVELKFKIIVLIIPVTKYPGKIISRVNQNVLFGSFILFNDEES